MTNPTEAERKALAEAWPEAFEWNYHKRQIRFLLGETTVMIPVNGDSPTVSIGNAGVLSPGLSERFPISPELGLAALTARCKEVARAGYWLLTEANFDGAEPWQLWYGPNDFECGDTPWAALLAATADGE